MPKIAVHNEVITVIVIFSIAPAVQQKLIDAIVPFLRIVKRQPGFISACIHKSTDGYKVANYAQWRSQKDYDAFLNNAAVQAQGKGLRDFGIADIHVYEVVISESKVGIPTISKDGYLAHIAEFRMAPHNQPRMVELAKEHIRSAMTQPGLLTASFHRSLDRTRVINYGQWSSAKDIEKLRQQPGFGSQKPYWEGIAENEFHLYEVVHVQTAR
ncbi:MAG: antibiotic biosynthesis monooxygenase [Acaryochloris sp. RU_4_1]|nr:antibiotic biosynthesis monooxygenase [Acaryochloris sp. RU_4_1]